MAYTTIDDPSDYFNTVLYTGNGSTQSITGVGFDPDWVWIKARGDGSWPRSLDSVRGATKELYQNTTNAENTEAAGLTSFDSDGFSLGSNAGYNGNTVTFASWNWFVGGTRTTNTEDGNNPGGGYTANTTAGFSIVDYVGTGAAGTMAHGLGAVPHMIVVRNREIVGSWIIYHHKNTAAPNTNIMDWSSTAATYDNSTYWNDTTPTSTVFTINTSNDVNKDADDIIAYVFTSIQGYSKFGSYTGNGNAEGPMIYTGFKPAWLLYKNVDSVSNWVMRDNKRTTSGGTNPNGSVLLSNDPAAESTNDSATVIDLLSNGFKIRNTENNDNTSGDNYLYMAFAEQPFVTSGGVPCTAK